MATGKVKVTKYYINKLCHFENTAISREEGGYTKIKH